jgi:hypothetical protein
MTCNKTSIATRSSCIDDLAKLMPAIQAAKQPIRHRYCASPAPIAGSLHQNAFRQMAAVHLKGEGVGAGVKAQEKILDFATGIIWIKKSPGKFPDFFTRSELLRTRS